MTVFIIEDDPLFSNAWSAYLRESGVDQVYEFQFVSDAIKQFELTPDVIIMDHYIQGLTGLEFLPLIKERLPKATLFYVSGQTKIEILAEAKLLGVDRYFQKDKDVFKNISNALKQPRTAKQSNSGGIFKRIKSKFQKTDPPSIFIMDDDQLFSTFVRHKVSKFGDFAIKTFNEKDDLIAAAHEKPDVLILDYHLSGITGNVVLEEFKALCPKTKVIMFTSQQSLETAIDLFDAGIVDYVVKNTSWENSLKAVLKKQLNVPLN